MHCGRTSDAYQGNMQLQFTENNLYLNYKYILKTKAEFSSQRSANLYQSTRGISRKTITFIGVLCEDLFPQNTLFPYLPRLFSSTVKRRQVVLNSLVYNCLAFYED
jgi:hypothetical protein